MRGKFIFVMFTAILYGKWSIYKITLFEENNINAENYKDVRVIYIQEEHEWKPREVTSAVYSLEKFTR